MNRGVARRTIFEGASDVRFFLSRLAKAVRRGDLEIHAYSILTTHFHLLVRSPRGRLSVVMKMAQNEHVRRFNRARRRDGPLVRGRFLSKPVRSEAYKAVLVRYIDQNPIAARLVSHPCAYPHGSAWHYAREGGPPWLERGWVEEHVRRMQMQERFDAAAYRRYAGAPFKREFGRWVEGRIAAKALQAPAPDPVDDLLAGAPTEVLSWMRRKARLADATGIGLAVVSPGMALEIVSAHRQRAGDWVIGSGRSKEDAWRLVRVGLLRDLSACTFEEIGRRLGVSTPHATRLYRRHRLSLDDPTYAIRIGEYGAAAIHYLLG